MSQKVENILYVGHNIQLAKAMLDPGLAQANNYLHHLTHVDEIQSALEEREYTRLICELAFSKDLSDKIAADFPRLKTTYLHSFETAKEAELSMVMEELASNEVKATLDHLSIPICFKNSKGQFLACNSYFSKQFGLTPEQIRGKTFTDIAPVDTIAANLLEEIEKRDEKVFSEQQVCFYELQMNDLSGREHHIVLREESIANTDIQIGMIFDITEFNETRTLLEKERVMLRATADISKDLIFFKDLQRRFLGCNKQFEKFVGCPEKDIIGKMDEQLFEFDQALMSQDQDQRVMTENRVHIGKEYLTYNSGERHFINMKKEPLLDKKGNVQGLIGIGRDISGHNLMQKRLKIADAVFQNSKESLLVTDEQGDIVSVNKAMCKASGYSENDFLNSNIKEFASGQHAQIAASLLENKYWHGEVDCTRKDGHVYFVWLEAYVVEHAEKGIFNHVYSLVSLNQTEGVEEKIQHLAKLDPLTGLFNRIALFTRLEDAITRADYKQTSLAVLFVDINDFKVVNEQYSRNAGDAVLIEIAERLKLCVFAKDTVARFGDDEFVILLEDLANEQDAAIAAQKISAQFDSKFAIGESEEDLSAMIGIAIYPDDGEDVDTLIDSAKKAMQRGKGGESSIHCHFYTQELTDHSNQQFELEDELKLALQEDQFEIYYQPQYDFNKRRVVAVEALLRWNHPLRGRLHPESFLSLAENNGLVVPIGLQMIYKVAMQAVAWQKNDIHFGRIAINLSKVELSEAGFIAALQTVLLETKCLSQWLEFEVSEVIFENSSPIIHGNLLNISKLGIALTVGDFGDERILLHLFEQLKIEKLKISKQYTEGMYAQFVGKGVQNAILGLGRSLGVDVVAESLINMVEESFSEGHNAALEGGFQSNEMKASEATFYLRCNKRK